MAINVMNAESLDHQVGGDHYKKLQMQPIELILECNCNYIQGNVIKYVSRHHFKNGAEDLEKAKHYLKFAIDSSCEMENLSGFVPQALRYCRINTFGKKTEEIILSLFYNELRSAMQQIETLKISTYGQNSIF
jgi:Protein of unknwon function (DUF3310).